MDKQLDANASHMPRLLHTYINKRVQSLGMSLRKLQDMQKNSRNEPYLVQSMLSPFVQTIFYLEALQMDYYGLARILPRVSRQGKQGRDQICCKSLGMLSPFVEPCYVGDAHASNYGHSFVSPIHDNRARRTASESKGPTDAKFCIHGARKTASWRPILGTRKNETMDPHSVWTFRIGAAIVCEACCDARKKRDAW